MSEDAGRAPVLQFTAEDFDAWRAHPITVAVFAAVDMLGAAAKEKWLAHSWDQGMCDPRMLSDLKARAEVASDLTGMDYTSVERWHEDERKRD